MVSDCPVILHAVIVRISGVCSERESEVGKLHRGELRPSRSPLQGRPGKLPPVSESHYINITMYESFDVMESLKRSLAHCNAIDISDPFRELGTTWTWVPLSWKRVRKESPLSVSDASSSLTSPLVLTSLSLYLSFFILLDKG